MMRISRWKQLAGVLAVGLAAATAVPAISSTAPVVSAQASIGPGGEYFPVTPTRILDTREDDDALFGAKRTDANGETFSLKVTGRDGVPENNVLAVAVNVVAVQPQARGSITARPTGASSASTTSLVNFNPASSAVGNLGIVGVGSNGSIDLQLTTPQASTNMHVVVDLYGWVATSGHNDAGDDGARVRTITPDRFMDTREAGLLPSGMSSPRRLGANESVELPIRGVGDIPNNGNVTGVIVNLTGISPTSNSRLTLTPTRPTAPVETANGNYAAFEVRGSLAIVPLSNNGSIWITAGPGSLDATVDVVGYLQTGASESTDAGRVVPLESPFRSFDTREPEFGSVRLGPSQWEDWSFTRFSESVELDGVTNIEQQGFFGNLSAFSLQNAPRTFLTLNPREPVAFGSEPDNASLNHAPAQVVTNNMQLVKYGTNGQGDDAVVSAFNRQGSVHYTLDIFAVVLDD